MTILNEKHKKWPIYHQLQKCGNLTISQDLLLMGLNCFYCSCICTKLDEFLKHIKEEHLSDILDSYGVSRSLQENEDENSKLDSEDQKSLSSFSNKIIFASEAVEEVAIKLEPSLLFEGNQDEDNDDDDAVDDFFDNFGGDNDPFENYEDDEGNEDETPLQVERIFIKEEKASMDWSTKNVDANVVENSSTSGTCKKRKSKLKVPKKNKIKTGDTEEKDDTDSDEDSDLEPKIEAYSDDNDVGDTDTSHRTKINLFSEAMHDIVTHIIEYYQKNPILWNPQHMEFLKSHKKLSLLKDLTLELEIRFHQTLQPKDLRRIFVDLRRLYYKALKNGENGNSKLWFFDKIKFLPKHKDDIKSHKTLPAVSVGMEYLLNVAKAYEEYPILWNLEAEGYRDKNLRNEALEQMGKKLDNKPVVTELRLAITRMRNLYMADKGKRIKCEAENIEFKPNNQQLYEQLQYLEKHIGPYCCNFEGCNEGQIRSYDKYISHIAAHEGRKGFTCKYCNQDYSTFGNLEIHIRRRHTHETPYKCPFCEKSFTTSADLNTHKNIHQGVKPFICHLCGKGFPSSSYLSRHYMRHDPETYQFQCPQCPKKFCEKYRLREHLNSHMQLREHICGVCGKGFFAHKTLKQHEQLHSDLMKYECSLCGKRFKQISAMYSHKKCHHNAVNFGDV